MVKLSAVGFRAAWSPPFGLCELHNNVPSLPC